ncbi:MAG: hypothetical protein ACLGIT_05460 [Gammaproteobacteria bacterium]
MTSPHPQPPRHRLAVRVAALLACALAGAAVGAIGSALSGDATWYVAIPAALALGWWYFADPTACDRRPDA